MYTLIEIEKDNDNIHEESFDTLKDANDRIFELYREVVYGGNIGEIKKAEFGDNYAIVYYKNGNYIKWFIE